MKKFLIVFAALAFASQICQAQLNSEFVKVYKQDARPMMLPVYLTIKPLCEAYDMYFVSNMGGVMGKYEQKGDTIILTPQKRTHGFETYEDVNSKNMRSSIPRVFLKRGNKLVDITPYKNYPELAEWRKRGNKGYDFYQIM